VAPQKGGERGKEGEKKVKILRTERWTDIPEYLRKISSLILG